MKKKSTFSTIAILIPYFGKWPEWIDYFIESCRYNPTIDWIFFTDCGTPNNIPKNIIIHEMSFVDYRKLLQEKLGVNTEKMTPYKLCDFKPTYGFIHEDDIKDYDFFGFGDIDVIYGNIRAFLTEEVLKNNVISTHNDRISGHFALFRNNDKYRNAFMKIPNWKSLLENEKHFGVDEGAFSRIFRRRKKGSILFFLVMRVFDSYHRKTYFVEQYSTILAPIPWIDGSYKHPTIWYWRKGHLTNNKDGKREFMYLHFMNFKSDKWLKEELRPAKWSLIDSIVKEPFPENWDGFMITDTGFNKL